MFTQFTGILLSLEKMEIQEVKKISIYVFLKSLGINPVRVHGTGSYAMYKSPFRLDTNASFKVDFSRNIWCDYGQSRNGKVCDGGTIIDLVMRMYNVNTITQVMNILNKNSNRAKCIINPELNKTQQGLKINTITEIKHPALINYHISRAISPKTANSYLKEVHYRIYDKNYFALGFKNDQGGWELRNKYFKGASSPKFHTYIIKTRTRSLDLFEGYFDFLSFIELNNITELRNSVLVLNSCSFVNACIPILASYDQINCYMDNDTYSKKGAEVTKLITTKHPNVVDHSRSIYPDVKDLNEYLCKKQKRPPKLAP